MLPRGGIDARDPKPPEFPFADLPIAEGIVPRPLGGFANGPVLAAFGAEITLRQLEKFLFSFSLGDSAFDTGHDVLLFKPGSFALV